MALIANPKSELLREPNLLVPNKKPVGPVKVDWNNPICKGISNCILPSIDDSVIVLAGDEPTYHASNTITSKIDHDHGLTMTNNGEKLNSQTGYNKVILPAITSQAFSCLFVGVRYSSIVGTQISYGVCSRFITESAGLSLALGNGYNTPNNVNFGSPVAMTNPHVYWMGQESSDGSDFSVINNVPMALVATIDSHTIGSDHLLLAKNSASNDRLHACDSGFMFYVAWNRSLSPSEAKSLSLDPYQFLIPA